MKSTRKKSQEAHNVPKGIGTMLGFTMFTIAMVTMATDCLTYSRGCDGNGLLFTVGMVCIKDGYKEWNG